MLQLLGTTVVIVVVVVLSVTTNSVVKANVGLSRDFGEPAIESSSSMPACRKLKERRFVKDDGHSLSQVGTFSPIKNKIV